MDKKPYLIRAIYDWCIDNENTPYVMSLVEKKTLIPEALSSQKKLFLIYRHSQFKIYILMTMEFHLRAGLVVILLMYSYQLHPS